MYTRETITMDETNAHEEPANATQRPQNPLALNAEWLASLSHELRGPLTAIQGYTSMLLRHKDRISPEEHQEFLQAISQGSGRMACVLDRFLDIANLEAGTIQLHPEPVDMNQLVGDILLATQQKRPDKSLSLTFEQESDPTLPPDQRLFIINADVPL